MALTEQLPYAGGFLLSEDKSISRDVVTLASGSGVLKAGTVLGKITAANAATATAASGNDSTASLGTITVSNTANTGTYTLAVTAAAAGETPAKFTVTAPDGATANGSAGVAFSALGLSFTLTDGTTTGAVAANDAWTIAVQAGLGQYAPYDNDANDGTEVAAAILYQDTDITTDAEATAYTRLVEVHGARLIWGSGVTTDAEKAAAIADLAGKFIIVR